MNTKMTIRLATDNDALEISKLILDNAEILLKPYYSKEQFAVFTNYYSEEVVRKKIESYDFFCAELQSIIVGTIALDVDFVVGFYTHPKFTHQGIGKTLLNYLENFAKNKGLEKIKLASSPVGVHFYLKYNWRTIRDEIIEYYGVGFEETIMEKVLI